MKKKLVNSQISNFLTYQMYLRQLLTLAENVFEFTNLPEFIDVSYLNKQLLRKGSVAFFKDEVMGLLALPYNNIGTLDVYGRPKSIQVIARNGYTRTLKQGEFVIMYDNNGRYPLLMDIYQNAERIALCKRVIDINISQQRTPRIWLTNSDKKRSVEDLVNDIDGNVERVLAYDNINLDDLQAVCEPAPFVADKIDIHLEKEWAEFFRLIGVANLVEQKKERLIQDEMTASLGGTIASRYSRFEPRKRAIEEINKKFGTDIKVRYYDGIPTTEKEVDNYIEDKEEINDDISISDNTISTN
jgi:hypothetical protein